MTPVARTAVSDGATCERSMPGFCRDCRRDVPERAGRCSGCGSPRVLRHGDLDTLAIAHVDSDAFYATIEKRDDPSLADKPVIVGGRQRGVVLTACYVARTFGVRSAMPMFEARRLCPHASIIRPNMEKYAGVAREVRALMLQLTPFVEPVSIDEGRELEHERPYLARDTGIFLHVRSDDAGMRAQAARLEHGHRRSHAERACHIAGSEHDTTGAAADDYGLVGKRWVIAFLDRGIERVAVDVGDAQCIDLGMAQQSR